MSRKITIHQSYNGQSQEEEEQYTFESLGTNENDKDFRLSINGDRSIKKAQAYDENIADHSTSNTR
jgi:hypothetical protein